jgi:hypothetical protein
MTLGGRGRKREKEGEGGGDREIERVESERYKRAKREGSKRTERREMGRKKWRGM